ncbi:MAG: CaiB/BaiF CoA transferase family protein [Candidatus Methylomirabilia bacterium]
MERHSLQHVVTPTALTGLRVIELGELVSAPYCGKLLADHGAEVVKVEPPEGDRARRHGPFPHDVPHPERSGLFCYLNTNKLGVTLDVHGEEDWARLHTLIGTADVLVENLYPPALEALGLAPEETRRRWPHLIHVSITPFGHRSPYRSWRGRALQASAAGAATVTIGEPGRPPLPLPVSQPDYQGGVNGAIGALLALFARERTGRGQHVDIATADVVAFYGGITSTMYTPYGLPWSREGHRASRSGGYYPYTILPSQDGCVCLITRSGHPWKRFCEAMGNPPWTRDPRYRDRRRMGTEYADEVDALLVPWLREHTMDELLEIFRRQGIPFSIVRTADRVARCPQLRARGFFVQISRAEVGALTYPGAPWKMSRTPWRVDRPAPLLGEHNEVVFDPALRAARAADSPRHPVSAVEESFFGGTMRPLEGVRVVDFGWVAVGPVLSSLLGEMGAEVIKVESRARLDYCRLIPKPVMEGESVRAAFAARVEEIDAVPMFHNYNRAKLGITVDLSHPDAPRLIRRLVAVSDVVVENFSPQVLREVGLDYEPLRAVRPDLIMISCSAAGQDGPWSDLRTFAPSLSSLAGLEALIGYRGERVLGALSLGYADPSNAHHGAFAVLAALWHRERTGEGQYIDMGQLETTVGLAAEPLMDFLMNGRTWGPQGSDHLSMAPHGHYPCRGDDEWVAIAAGDDDEWRRLAAALDLSDWLQDPRFETVAGRRAHAQEIDAGIAGWTRLRSKWKAAEELQVAEIAAFPVLRLGEQEGSTHFRARGLLEEVRHPEIGAIRVYKHPIRLSETPGVTGMAPRLGEHNDRVFREVLGLTDEEIRTLKAERVIY